MKERPILFSAQMVRALLAGTKTQTRRAVRTKVLPVVDECFRVNGKWCNHTFDYDLVELCPYGKPGDRLWVKETFSAHGAFGNNGRVVYRADLADGKEPHGLPWRPSIFMPRAASRIALEITGVRVERLNEITESDAAAEGAYIQKECSGGQWIICGPRIGCYREGYRWLWEKINGPGSWAEDPWVWVIEFRKVTP
jgi:hypothetical protein